MTDKQIICKCNDKECGQCSFEEQLKAKEQECEELKEIIDEAKNSKLDLKSFLVGEAVQNEYEQQLDQLKEQLEAYKMEAEEGKEINAELKAENEELKFQNKRLDEVASYWHKRIFKVERSERKLKQTLTEIKEIAEAESYLSPQSTRLLVHKILQKISECEENNG